MTQQTFKDGARAALPIIFGYVPIGLACGVAARGAGLGLTDILLMSTLVYAGSSQFVAIAMWGAGQAAGAIIATTLLVNLRHLLFSAALAPAFREVKPATATLLAHTITDESFAVTSADLRGRPASVPYLAGLQLSAQFSWILFTGLGAVIGLALPPSTSQALGLDFALPAMFVALLLLQIERPSDLAIALLAGSLSVAGALWLPGGLHVLLATVLTASLGLLFEGSGVATE